MQRRETPSTIGVLTPEPLDHKGYSPRIFNNDRDTSRSTTATLSPDMGGSKTIEKTLCHSADLSNSGKSSQKGRVAPIVSTFNADNAQDKSPLAPVIQEPSVEGLHFLRDQLTAALERILNLEEAQTKLKNENQALTDRVAEVLNLGDLVTKLREENRGLDDRFNDLHAALSNELHVAQVSYSDQIEDRLHRFCDQQSTFLTAVVRELQEENSRQQIVLRQSIHTYGNQNIAQVPSLMSPQQQLNNNNNNRNQTQGSPGMMGPPQTPGPTPKRLKTTQQYSPPSPSPCIDQNLGRMAYMSPSPSVTSNTIYNTEFLQKLQIFKEASARRKDEYGLYDNNPPQAIVDKYEREFNFLSSAILPEERAQYHQFFPAPQILYDTPGTPMMAQMGATTSVSRAPMASMKSQAASPAHSTSSGHIGGFVEMLQSSPQEQDQYMDYAKSTPQQTYISNAFQGQGVPRSMPQIPETLTARTPRQPPPAISQQTNVQGANIDEKPVQAKNKSKLKADEDQIAMLAQSMFGQHAVTPQWSLDYQQSQTQPSYINASPQHPPQAYTLAHEQMNRMASQPSSQSFSQPCTPQMYQACTPQLPTNTPVSTPRRVPASQPPSQSFSQPCTPQMYQACAPQLPTNTPVSTPRRAPQQARKSTGKRKKGVQDAE